MTFPRKTLEILELMCKENRAMYASEVMNLPNNFLHKLNIYSFLNKWALNKLVVKSKNALGKVQYQAVPETFAKYKTEALKERALVRYKAKPVYKPDDPCARCGVGIRTYRSYCADCNNHYSKMQARRHYARLKHGAVSNKNT